MYDKFDSEQGSTLDVSASASTTRGGLLLASNTLASGAAQPAAEAPRLGAAAGPGVHVAPGAAGPVFGTLLRSILRWVVSHPLAGPNTATSGVAVKAATAAER